MTENKNYKNDERANGSPKTVAVTAADNSIRETYLMCEKDLTAVRCGLAMEKSRDCASKGIWTDIGTTEARTLFDDNCVKKAFLQISSKRKDRDVASIYVSVMTKCQILLFYAAIYDPSGLLCPIIFPWKLVVQDSWKKGMSWDEKLKSEEMRAAWS
ncbi:Abscisic-aldehyde oxidase [Dirofilaria immitis]